MEAIPTLEYVLNEPADVEEKIGIGGLNEESYAKIVSTLVELAE